MRTLLRRILRMGWKMKALLLTLAAAGISALAQAEMADATEATAFDKRASTVLVFIATDCPIANGMAPELKKIQGDFGKKDVAFYRIYCDPTLDEAGIEKHGEEYGLAFPAVFDREQELVKLTGATITPEAVVYDREGKRVYRGRINNRYEDLGKYRQRATQHDLRDALEAVLSGREVRQAETKAIGCFLPQPQQPEKEPAEDEAPAN